MGSNLGDRAAHLTSAIDRIPEVVAASSFWETAPVGGPEQASFVNCVIELSTVATGRELLEVCRERERDAKRVREVHWGPRTLDVDVLWIDGVSIDESDLTVPHPRMFERMFVMVPLRELAPDLIPADFTVPPISEVWPFVDGP